MKLKFVSKSASQTISFAKTFAKSFSEPIIVSLVGDLGAGKTTFTKGFAEGIGVSDTVTSPTFTIMSEYSGDKFSLYHFDLYRLKDLDEARELGLDEYFDENHLKGFVVCEWAENAKGILPPHHFEISIEKKNDSERVFLIEEKK